MMKLDEDSHNKGAIGNSYQCTAMEYASIQKYLISLGPDHHLSQLKFFFKRNQYLLAIQLIFQSTEYFGKLDPSTYKTYGQKYLGPLPEYDPTNPNTINDIEEFTLHLSLGEEIHSFSGCFKENSFVRINIKTIFGKFFFIGDKTLKNNFNFNYYYNKNFFDGFIIGFDETKIIYLVSLICEDESKEIETKKLEDNKYKKELNDISEDASICLKADPIYKTNIFGVINKKTIIIDDIEKIGINNKDLKENKGAISEIKIFFNPRKITRIDNQYTFYDSGNSVIMSHQSQKYKEGDSELSIKIEKDDYINHVIVYLSPHKKVVQDLYLVTFKGKKLGPVNKTAFSRELKEVKGKRLKILGMCVGREKHVQFIQFYYEYKDVD